MSQPSGPLNTPSARPEKSINKQIFRALLSIASAALLVRIFGMLNQIVVSGRFGAGAAMDAYFVASALPILLAQLANSAVESSVIPVYARVRLQGEEQASIVFSTLLNLLLLGTVLLTLLIIGLRYQVIYLSAPALDPFSAGLAGSLAPVIFPVLVLMVLISFLECILNVEGQFGWPAYAGLLVPLTTAIFVLVGGRAVGVVMLCIGMLAGLCLQICVVIVRAQRAGLVYRFILDLRNPEIGAILVAAWPVLIGALIGQASPLVDQIFASFLSAGSISALNYSLKLISVPIGVIFVSIGRAAIPHLSRQASINDMKAFKETLHLYFWVVGSGTVVLTAFMLVLAHPLVQILFQHGAFSADDTNRTASALMGFTVGLTPIALGDILAKAFSALGKTKVLMGVTMFSVIANATFDYIFARFWQSTGIALATSAVYTCTMFILFFKLRRVISKLDLFTPPPQVLKVIWKLGLGSYFLRLVNWKEEYLSSFSITYGLRQWTVRIAIAIATFALGVVGAYRNSLFTLRVAFGSVIVVAFLRYRYALLITWVLLDVFIGSTLPFFNGNNFDTALTAPTLLLMTCMPIKQTFKRVPALAVLFIYLLWVLVSAIANATIDIGTFLPQWLLLLDSIAVAILTINVLTTRRRMLRLIDTILIVTTFVSLYGIYGYITKQNGTPDDITPSLFRITSIFASTPTTLALFLSIIIPLALYRTFTLQGFKRIGSLILVILFLVTLGLTFTRATYISVPLGMGIMVLFLPSRKMKIGLFSGIASLAILAVLLAVVGNVPIFDRFFEQDVTTLNGRIYLWNGLLDHFDPTQLLGNGPGASDFLLARLGLVFGLGLQAIAPHSLFLGTLYDFGIIGVTLLIGVFIALLVSLITGMRKATNDHRVLFAAALAVFVNVILQSFASNDFWIQGVDIYFWIIMVLPFALCWSTPKQLSETDAEYLDEATEPRMEAIQPAEREHVSHV